MNITYLRLSIHDHGQICTLPVKVRLIIGCLKVWRSVVRRRRHRIKEKKFPLCQ